ncbi:hypothetical protein O6H91_Y553600 [Diphasiastrum complanatum]|nr:hypothetical protein O6H91_Y553600 [Diphasiastrum complanatum]
MCAKLSFQAESFIWFSAMAWQRSGWHVSDRQGPQTSTVDLCKMCELQLNGGLQLAYHNVSGAHLKKLRAYLKQFGLLGYCFACNEELSNPEETNAHVQKQEHKEKVTKGIRSTRPYNAKSVCDPCCLQFTEVVGWELHLTTCGQKEEGVTPNSPGLSSLLRQLSGSSLDVVSPNFEPFCSLCEKIFESLDEFVNHLVARMHIQNLRMSSCYACKKDFLHIMDLGRHLFTSKHQTNVQFHNEYLSRRNGDVIQLKQGYSCQPCLI